MKDSIRISLIGIGIAGCMALAMFLSPTPDRHSSELTPEEISWIEFCKAKGYSIHANDDTIINEYLDTWCGSAQEEEALTRNGAKA